MLMEREPVNSTQLRISVPSQGIPRLPPPLANGGYQVLLETDFGPGFYVGLGEYLLRRYPLNRRGTEIPIKTTSPRSLTATHRPCFVLSGTFAQIVRSVGV